jgi:hypothetical protein
MARCWGNAGAEHIFTILKHRLALCGDAKKLFNPQQLIGSLPFLIEGYYKRELRYSMIGHFRTIDREQQFVIARTLTPVKP